LYQKVNFSSGGVIHHAAVCRTAPKRQIRGDQAVRGAVEQKKLEQAFRTSAKA
jgi:hypothetical protein